MEVFLGRGQIKEERYRHLLNAAFLNGIQAKWLGIERGQVKGFIRAGLLQKTGEDIISQENSVLCERVTAISNAYHMADRGLFAISHLMIFSIRLFKGEQKSNSQIERGCVWKYRKHLPIRRQVGLMSKQGRIFLVKVREEEIEDIQNSV